MGADSAITDGEKTPALPKGWRWVRLAEVCRQDRVTVDPSSSEAKSSPYLGLERIEANTGRIIRSSAETAQENDEGRSNTFAFGPSHVLYGKLRPYLNKVAVPEFTGRCTTEAIPLLPSPNVDRMYLAWLMRRTDTVAAAMRGKSGSRMPRADMDDLLELAVPMPPLPEQRRIAGILQEQMSAVERARSAALAQLEAARALPAAYLRQVFNSDEARQWPHQKLRELSRRITDGTHLLPSFTASGVPFLFVRNIVGGSIDFANIPKFVSEATFEELTKRCKPEEGDVLFSAVGSFGVAVPIDTDRPFTFQRHIAHIKPDFSRISTRFLSYYLNSPLGREQSETAAMGGAQRTVTLKSLASFEIPVPPLPVQQQIEMHLGDRLKVFNQSCRALEAQLDAIDRLPAALLRRAFAGEV